MKAKSGAYRSAKKNNNSAGKKRFSPALRGHDKRPTKREKEKKELSTQQSIPYKAMYKDGICYGNDGRYSKTVRFYDINYQLAMQEDKAAIFENWCDFLNYFDSSIHFQLSFLNQHINFSEYQKMIDIPACGDDFDEIRTEYTHMLQDQLAKGNNGMHKAKYITFSVEAKNYPEAKVRLERIETDVMANFKVLGVRAESTDGYARLKLMHDTFCSDTREPFQFDYEYLKESGLSTKDFIAPTSLNFKPGRYFRMGGNVGAVSYLQITAPELTDKLLAQILDIDSDLVLTLHIHSLDQTKAIKNVKSKLTDLDRMKMDEQKKAVRGGYDMDILPADLLTFGHEAKKLLEDLQSRNERMFMVTVLLLMTAPSKKQLENSLFQASSIAQQANCTLRRLDYRQEAGLMSSLPLAINQIPIERGLTTSSTAIFIPFTTQELFQGGNALYYGLNALSSNMIMVDRRNLKNPNGLILGTPGSGKSFSAKREITNVFLVCPNDSILICDPESEYTALIHALHGQVVKIAANSKDYINPLDINMNYSEDDSPLQLKSEFILSLFELIMGRNGIEGEERSIIDQAIRAVYQTYLADPKPENMPILEDLYNYLAEYDHPKAKRIATTLDIYVHGSLNVFNHRTNIDLSNRLVCFDIKDLGKQLKKLGMLIVQDQVWGRVTENRAAHRHTWFYCDEFHLLLKEEQTASYSVEIWKRFRKWGGIPTGVTQNVKDLLSSREIENIFENSDFIYMLNQASGDRQILAKALSISPHQLSYVTNSSEGEGLLFYGNVIIPFRDHFPRNTKLYRIMSTKLTETA